MKPVADRPKLSFVFPVFDEEENIGPLLDSACALGERLAGDFEIVVVDDGSRDASARRIAEKRAREPRIRSVHHESNRGYGAALKAGLYAARGDLIFFSDADRQFSLDELELLLDRAKRFDIVAGFRSPRRDPWGRRVIAFVWGNLVRALFGLRIRDIDCAFKVFRRDVIEAIPIESIGAFVNTEILVRARQAGFQICQVPVSHFPRRHGRQSGAHPRVMLRAFIELATLYGSLRRSRR